ncbi:hypothetical protein CCACVL1_01680, partial [Corchorus capsularis]
EALNLGIRTLLFPTEGFKSKVITTKEEEKS